MKNRAKPMRRVIANLVFLFCVLHVGTSEIDIKTFFYEIGEARNVSFHLEGLSSWSADQLEHRKLEGALLKLLGDDRLLKSETTLALNVISQLALSKEVIEHDPLGKKLLELFPEMTSPTFQRDAFKTMGQLDEIENASVSSGIAKLVGKVIADAIAPKKKQVYSSSLHAEALAVFDASKVTKDQIETLQKLLESSEDLSPVLQQGLHKAIMNLAVESPKAFGKRDKTSFLSILLDQIKKSPGKMAESASENEIATLISAIGATGPLLTSEDTLAKLSEGTDLMLDLFASQNDSIFMAASRVLLAITKADLPRSKLKLDTVVYPDLEKATKTTPKSKRVKELIKILIDLEGYLLTSEAKGADDRLADLLDVLHVAVMTHPDLKAREIALDGFFVLEPKFFSTKILNKDARKTLKKFADKSVTLMSDKNMKKQIPQLLERMGNVLFEMTGQDYGTDAKLWGQWLRTEGSDFFNN